MLGYGVFWADWGNDGHIFLPVRFFFLAEGCVWMDSWELTMGMAWHAQIRNWVAEKKASFWSVQVPAAPQSAAGGRATPATDERK